ncbi:MAG: TrmH family RNA methyltransferase [Ilumatobacteraceae bacterium]
MVEGTGLVTEAARAGWTVHSQFFGAGAEPVPGLDAPAYELGRGVLERVATTATPQPHLAVVAMPDPDLSVLERAAFVVVADRLADPGNAGTILRSAEAAGADAVVLTAGSVDPFNPKVVRASAGALFHVPRGPGRGPGSSAPLTPSPSNVIAPRTAVHRLATSHVAALVLGNEAHGLA